jgi:hypothetical protein
VRDPRKENGLRQSEGNVRQGRLVDRSFGVNLTVRVLKSVAVGADALEQRTIRQHTMAAMTLESNSAFVSSHYLEAVVLNAARTIR